MLIQLIRCYHNRLVLVTPISFETDNALWCEIDVVGLAGGDVGLIDHVAELGGLCGLEVDGIEGVRGEGGEGEEGWGEVVRVAGEGEGLGVGGVELDELLLE